MEKAAMPRSVALELKAEIRTLFLYITENPQSANTRAKTISEIMFADTGHEIIDDIKAENIVIVSNSTYIQTAISLVILSKVKQCFWKCACD